MTYVGSASLMIYRALPAFVTIQKTGISISLLTALPFLDLVGNLDQQNRASKSVSVFCVNYQLYC